MVTTSMYVRMCGLWDRWGRGGGAGGGLLSAHAEGGAGRMIERCDCDWLMPPLVDFDGNDTQSQSDACAAALATARMMHVGAMRRTICAAHRPLYDVRRVSRMFLYFRNSGV